jgi:carbon monoxide dehydrogenase subunit G
MAKITGTIDVSRPPAEVFAYLDDLANRPAWQTELVSTKVLTDGPTRVGTEVEETRSMGKRTFTSRWRVTLHDPPQRSEFVTYDGQMMKPSGVVTVTPEGSGSRVTFAMDPNPSGFAKLMMPMIAPRIRKNIATDLANLKRNLETK